MSDSADPALTETLDPTISTMVASRLPITVVIATKNEAPNIRDCIRSVRWASEILVVDDGSEDGTVDLALEAGATVIPGTAETIGLRRNQAIERAACDWILVIDADERAESGLAHAIQEVIAADHARVGFRVFRRNFFLGREIRHGGWERDRPLRLFRNRYRYDAAKVHEKVVVDGPVGELKVGFAHHPYRSLDHYFEKFQRYSTWWAEQQFARGRRASIAALIVKPPFRFWSMYLFRRGFADGAEGLVLALLAAASVFVRQAKLWGRWRQARADRVR